MSLFTLHTSLITLPTNTTGAYHQRELALCTSDPPHLSLKSSQVHNKHYIYFLSQEVNCQSVGLAIHISSVACQPMDPDGYFFFVVMVIASCYLDAGDG